MTKARDLANLLGGGTSGVATFGGTAAIRVPNGTTEQRPTPAAGMIRYNTTVSKAEVYDGTIWAAFGSAPPTISTVSPETYNGESGTTFTITGTNFSDDATVFFITSGGTEVQAATVSVVSAIEITATTPQDFTVADEPLDVKVVQSSGTVTALDAIDCGGVPAWTTSSGQLGGNVLEGSAYSQTIVATDPDSGATITYSIVSGSLPSGITLNSATGVISGTAPLVASTTTYNFTVAATDNAGNSTSRAFSIVVVDPVADAGGGEGYATQYSDATIANQVTSTSNTILTANVTAATPNNPAGWLDFTSVSSANSSLFKIHSGHDGVTPNRLAVRVSTGTPRVLNRYRWIKHSNACGNIDIYGSNKAIDSSNWTDMGNWTHLGRGHMGGYGSESDGTVKTATFNSNNYGYRWYLVLVRDYSNTPLPYPQVGTMQGYAMYGATFDMV